MEVHLSIELCCSIKSRMEFLSKLIRELWFMRKLWALRLYQHLSWSVNLSPPPLSPGVYIFYGNHLLVSPSWYSIPIYHWYNFLFSGVLRIWLLSSWVRIRILKMRFCNTDMDPLSICAHFLWRESVWNMFSCYLANVNSSPLV